MAERKTWFNKSMEHVTERVSGLLSKGISYAQQLREDVSMMHKSSYRGALYVGGTILVGGLIWTAAAVIVGNPVMSALGAVYPSVGLFTLNGQEVRLRAISPRSLSRF